jgi:excisionase family DNA binding protein
MTVLSAILAEATEGDLDALADLLAPRIAQRTKPAASGTKWLRGANAIAEYIGAPRSRVYALVEIGRLPVKRDGSALVARTEDLDAWLEAGGAKRP